MSKVRKGIVLLVTAATMTIVPAAMHASGASEAVRKPVPVTAPSDGSIARLPGSGGTFPSLRGATWQ